MKLCSIVSVEEVTMGLCISKQQAKKHNSKRYTTRQSSKVEPVAQPPNLEEAIDRVEKIKESTEDEVVDLQQQLKETG